MSYDADSKTQGGRIRLARIEANKTIKALAEILNISANHLGLVERGIKNASDNLIMKIAEATGASYSWIVDGNGGISAEPVGSELSWSEVDIQAFLALAMTLVPLSKGELAKILGIPTASIERIIAGGEVAYDPMWEHKMSAMAQMMDLDRATHAIEYLAKMLNEEKRKQDSNIAMYAIKEYLRARQQRYDVLRSGWCETILYHDRIIRADQLIVQSADAAEGIWRFYIYADRRLAPAAKMITEEQVVEAGRLEDDEKVFLVCTDEASFSAFSGVNMNEQCLRICKRKDVRVILVDTATRAVTAERHMGAQE